MKVAPVAYIKRALDVTKDAKYTREKKKYMKVAAARRMSEIELEIAYNTRRKKIFRAKPSVFRSLAFEQKE